MRAAVQMCLLVVLATLTMGVARADVVVLRNGGKLSGKITRETVDEIELTLADGMRMTLRRSRIQTIERDDPPESSEPGEEPLWTPRKPTEHAEVRPAPEPDAPPRPAIRPPAGPCENSPFTAWNSDFARYPVIMAAKNTLFRSYRLIRRTPLVVDPRDRRYAHLLRRHGHGGALSVWEFEYAGMGELRYGDQVRFVGEITTPVDQENQFIRLKAGKLATTPRLAIFLVKRNGDIKRYATPTVFAPPDFRQNDLKRLPEFQLNVRVYQDDYVPISSTWLEQTRSEFLKGVDSPLGNSIGMQIRRLRFRLEWFEMDPEDRPALDPDLISRDNPRPLAQPGRPVANDKLIRRAWGTSRSTLVEHNHLVSKLRAALSALDIKPDRNYIVEFEDIGILGAKGVSIETRRQFFTQELLEDLLTPR